MIDRELIKNLRILAAKQEKKQNDLLEAAMKDLLKKYEKKGVLIRSLLTD